jgi:hypothetical protein
MGVSMTETPRGQKGIPNDQLPETFRIADKLAEGSQRLYFGILRVELIFLVLASAAGVVVQPFGPALKSILAQFGLRAGAIHVFGWTVPQDQVNLALATSLIPAVLMLVVAASVLGRYAWHPDVHWRQQRAVAEGIAGLAWRYAMRAQPGELPDPPPGSLQGVDGFVQSFQQLLDEADGANLPSPVGPTARRITPRMEQIRAMTDPEQMRTIYIEGRILDQYGFYAKRSWRFARRRTWLRAGIVVAYVLAALALPFHGLSIFTTASAALGTWLGARQYEDLAQSYATLQRKLTALSQDGRALPLGAADGPARLARFVDEVETLFEGEHRQWLARQPRTAQ